MVVPLLACHSVAAQRRSAVAAAGATATGAVLVAAGLRLPGVPVESAVGHAVLATAVAWAFGDSHCRLAPAANASPSSPPSCAPARGNAHGRPSSTNAYGLPTSGRTWSPTTCRWYWSRRGWPGTCWPPTRRPRGPRSIADTGRDALAELRRLVAVPRVSADTDPPAYAPAPGLGQLGPLVDRIRACVPVEGRTEGAAVPLPPGVDLCAYRTVQEALTYVLRHAAPAKARLRLTYGPDRLTLRVADDGRATPVAAPGTGHGLAGMRAPAVRRRPRGRATSGRRLGGDPHAAAAPGKTQ